MKRTAMGSRRCPKCGHWKMQDIEGHKHTGNLCFWCGFREYMEKNPVGEQQPSTSELIADDVDKDAT